MKIIHSIQNHDVLNASSLSKAFSENRINKSICVSAIDFSVMNVWKNKRDNIYEINGKIILDAGESSPISKVIVYFPESKYSLERIFETKEYSFDFIHQNEVEKDYFNIVIFDKDNFVISSSTFVFDETRVIEHPIQVKDMSDLQAKNSLKEEQDSLVLETELKNNQEQSVVHIWQNVGQHYKIEKPKRITPNVFASTLPKEKMCSGIWMVIVIDKRGKLVTQYIITI